jgi:ribosome maturation factor RimP
LDSDYVLEGGHRPTFFVFPDALVFLMPHPLIPQITELAAPVAEALGLEVVSAVFQTNQHPPVLRVDVRNLHDDTGLDDCEQMSQALEAALDEAGIIPDAYVLEVSSPGVSQFLSNDRDFLSFKGFPVVVTASDPRTGGQKEWTGQLIRRDDEAVHLSQKGRAIAVPRHLIIQTQLANGEA